MGRIADDVAERGQMGGRRLPKRIIGIYWLSLALQADLIIYTSRGPRCNRLT